MRICLALFVALLIAIESPAASGDQNAANGSESLGGRLLDDLEPDANVPTTPRLPAQKPQSKTDIENSLKASTPPNGFGVGVNPISQPLARVGHGMKHAQELLAKTGSDAKTRKAQLAAPVQKEILLDLDKLVAELSKQCQCSGGQSQGGNQSPKPGQNAKSKAGKPGAAAGRGKSAARDSTDRLDRTSAQPVSKGEVDEMVKALWGNLPERSREQMLQSFSDEFLPKYELEIEQYYRRLSEEQGKR